MFENFVCAVDGNIQDAGVELVTLLVRVVSGFR
jgi:hypothetical protein